MRVKIGDFLKPVRNSISVQPDVEYKQVTVRMNNQGVCLRGIKKGSEIKTKKQFLVEPGQFILSKIDARNGAFGLVTDELDGAIVTQDFPTYSINHQIIDKDYLVLVTGSKFFVDLMRMSSSGTTNRKRLKEDKFLNFEIELPEKDRQIVMRKQMAKVISISTTIKEKIIYNHELLEKYDNNLLLQLISQDSNPVVTKKLSDLCLVITDGAHNTPTYLDEGIPFLSVKDITSGSFDFTNCRHISKEEHSALSKRCKPEFDDVLYTKVGTTGIAKKIDINKEFSIFVSLCLLKPNKNKVDSNFLEIALNSSYAKRQAKQRTRGIGNKNLVLKDVKEIQIPWIEKNKQTQIVTQYKTIKSKTADLIKFLHKLEESIPQLMEATFVDGK